MTAPTLGPVTTAASLRTAAPRNGQPARPTGIPTLNQTDFLKLLTAQLKNQDPTSPVDNAQFVGQMAQFSTVSGIEDLNEAMTGLASRLGASELGAAAAMVGGVGLTPSDSAAPDADGGIAGAVDLAAAAESLTLTIADSAGRPVRTLDLGAQPKGLASFRWDGRDDRGMAVAGDRFQLMAAARTGSVRSTPATLVQGRISGVEPTPTGARLVVEGVGPVPLTSLRRIDG